MHRRHLESVSSRSLSVRGSWGTAPSVFWFLLYAQKERPGGEPYRLCTLHILRDADRRPQIWLKNSFASFCRSKRNAPPARRADRHLPVTPRRRRRPQTIPCRVGIQILISKRPRPAARRLPTWSRISSAAHSSANRSPAPARRDPSPLQNIIINPSNHFPINSKFYTNLVQYFPIL